MRHRVKLNHLGRKSAHRKALLSHLACDLIRHKRIITTLAKAKALRVYVEPLITKSKTNTTHQRRVVFSYLQDKEVVTELFGDISAKIGNRPGGYTRIIKLGARLGDAAEMALIELVDYNEIYSNQPAESGKKRRTRRGGSSRSKNVPASEKVESKTTAEEASTEEEGAEATAAAGPEAGTGEEKALEAETKKKPASKTAAESKKKSEADTKQPKAGEEKQPEAETKKKPASKTAAESKKKSAADTKQPKAAKKDNDDKESEK